MSKKKTIFILFVLLFIFLGIGIKLKIAARPENIENIESTAIRYMSSNNSDTTYLSDLEYIKGMSYVGWDKIRYDEANGGSKIAIKIENSIFTFDKGIWAHATSQVTYNIGQYNYKYFTAFIGINSTSGSGDGVTFKISTSKDGIEWNEKATYTKKPGEEATFIKVDIEGEKYLRLYADANASTASDHSVYADAKLVNEIDTSSAFMSPDEYSAIINEQYNNEENITGELEFNLLKREFVKNIGKYTLNSLYNESDDIKTAIDYLMSDERALRYYILGGKPLGNNYYKSIKEYSRLYRNYKDDFNNPTVTKYGTKLGDLYLRMATSLSLTHSTLVGLWMNNASTPENQSDSVRRYAIIKYMHDNNLFTAGGVDYNSWFENYTVEEMRYVMANNIDDESMLWLNSYVRELIAKEGGARMWPHRYVSYVWPNYANPVYYAEENKDYFNDLFSVKDPNNEGQRIGLWDVVYTIPGGVDEPVYKLQIPRGTSDKKIYKLWMNMRNKFGTGAVCGGISKTGSNIRGVLGLPDAVVGQPGHAAHINYFQNSNGEGFWGIDNDVSGWAYTGASILLGWASAPYASGYTGTYIPLAQEVINHEDTYIDSQKFVYLADSYSDLTKREELYRKALEIQPLNLNAWYGLILTYNASNNKTEEEYYELAKEIAENLKYYPLPMYQMTNQIKPKLTSIGASYKFTLLQTRILKEASTIPNNSTEVLQPGITKLMGNYLLGQMDTSIATFSFDGEDAGKIVLSSRFDGNGVRWDYAIHGKGENGIWDESDFKEISFSADEEHKLQLTAEEIAAITAENDIYIHIVGVNYSEENVYKIDINESAGFPATFFASDLENKLLGAVDSLEWKYNENDSWTFYGNEQPDLTGDKTIIVRMGATGTYLASKSSVSYTFTENDTNNKRKYIPISHISLEAVSSEAVNQQGSAAFALDANYNTRWHSAWGGTDTERYITVKLDKPYNISAVEFVPAGGGNGKIYDGTVFGSMDGENWIIISQKKGLTYTNAANDVNQALANIKSFDADVPQRVQYVKIVADRTNGNWITARAFNFYEDTTVKIVANFTFDGAHAGEISLIDSEYQNTWEYSIDGGITWNSASGNKHKLSLSEIKNITSENGIKIKLANDDNEYRISIKESEVLEINPYVNDLENRLIGLTNVSGLEWKLSDEEEWKSYLEEEPIVEGNKILQVRRMANGITLPSNVLEFQFTDEGQTNKMKYIPVKHLSIHSFSSQSVDSKRPYYAPNAIDGNPNTEWHTDFRASIAKTGAHLAIKLDSPRYVSGIDYVHMDSTREPYGFMKNGKVSISVDGETWTEVATFQNVAQDDTLKHLEFNEAVYAQYVKLEIESYDNVFAAASMINLYEDITKLPVPTAEIEYSTTESTNQDVTARLVNPSTEIEIINNDGSDTYTFREDGEFTFKFRDKNGIEGTATAIVNWIIKTLPTVTVEYNTENPTNQNVTASISFDRDKTRIVDDKGNTIKTLALGEKYTVTFTENGTKEVKFVGPYGNASSTVINVDWIDRTAPTGTITYSTTSPTNKDIVATLTSNEDITITNNGGSATYKFTENNTFTFKFTDKAGNVGEATATVNWIDRSIAMPTITYDINKPTRENVTASITFDKDKTRIVDEEGNIIQILALGEEYRVTFTENETYEFRYIGPAGNEGTATATVNWIDRETPVATLTYNPTDLTNKDVTVTIGFNEKNVKILNNNGSNKYTFTENGTFVFEFEDEAGNKGTIPAVVNTIDKVAPTATIEYSTKELTKDSVTVTLKPSEEVTITNNDGKETYTFDQNDEFTFEFVDKAGNEGTATATVDWIDKEAPVGTITYSKDTLTNEDVVATITFNEENVTITSEGGNTYKFTKNDEFTFEFVDKAGNKGTATAKVTWIDKEAPVGTISYNNTNKTNQDIIATITFNEENVTITSEGGNTHKFTENGKFTFEYVDAAGNKGTTVAEVTWIDKNLPVATIKYNTTSLTNQNVVATISFDKENVTVEGGNTHEFTENGKYEFKFVEPSGNTGVVVVEVTWIDKVAPTAELKYEKQENKVVVSVINPSEAITFKEGNGVYEYTKNGNYEIIFYDLIGNESKLIAIIDSITEEIKDDVNKEEKPNVTPDDNSNVDKPDNTNSNSSTNSTKPDKDNSNKKPNDNSSEVKTDTDNNKDSDTSNNASKNEEKTTSVEKEEERKGYKNIIIISVIICFVLLGIYAVKRRKNK